MVSCYIFCFVLATACLDSIAAPQSGRPDTVAISGSASLRNEVNGTPRDLHNTRRSVLRVSAYIVSGRRLHEPRLDSLSDYVGPSDPANPSIPLVCNLAVRRAIDSAWSATRLASHRPPVSVNDKVEFGFAVHLAANQSILIDRMRTSDWTDRKPNELEIPINEATIATVHTHNSGALPTPSAQDVLSPLPAFVKSESYLFVTIPGTERYNRIELNRVCRTD